MISGRQRDECCRDDSSRTYHPQVPVPPPASDTNPQFAAIKNIELGAGGRAAWLIPDKCAASLRNIYVSQNTVRLYSANVRFEAITPRQPGGVLCSSTVRLEARLLAVTTKPLKGEPIHVRDYRAHAPR